MITIINDTDIYGNECKKYRLNQGDSFRFKATPDNNADLISKITFKISHKDYCEKFSKDYEKLEDGTWMLFVESADTENWEISNHDKYDYHTEIEVTYIDGGVDTVEEALLKVDPQIKNCGGI